MVKKYVVRLSDEERQNLQEIVTTGKRAAALINHARILLKADCQQSPGWRDQDIKEALDISLRTIERVRKRFVEEGLEAALTPRPHPRRPRKLDGTTEAHLVALCCSEPPEGRGRWTLRLLAQQMVELDYVDDISHESVRQLLKKTNSNPGDKAVG